MTFSWYLFIVAVAVLCVCGPALGRWVALPVLGLLRTRGLFAELCDKSRMGPEAFSSARVMPTVRASALQSDRSERTFVCGCCLRTRRVSLLMDDPWVGEISACGKCLCWSTVDGSLYAVAQRLAFETRQLQLLRHNGLRVFASPRPTRARAARPVESEDGLDVDGCTS